MIIRKAKIYEYICVVLLGSVIISILAILNKLTLLFGLDAFLGPILFFNMLMCILKFMKNKNKFNLLLMIALISIVISDISIALSTLVSSNSLFVIIMCMLTWPTYVLGCALINCYNYKKQKLYETEIEE